MFNPNIPGLFEGSFLLGGAGQFDPHHISRRTNLII